MTSLGFNITVKTEMNWSAHDQMNGAAGCCYKMSAIQYMQEPHYVGFHMLLVIFFK